MVDVGRKVGRREKTRKIRQYLARISRTRVYDKVSATTPFHKWQLDYFPRSDYTGTVLDLGCGTGGVGARIHEAGWSAEISGVDLSPLSLQTAQVKQHYTGSVSVGRM